MSDLGLVARQHQLTLRAQMMRTLAAVWPALDPKQLDATFPAWSAAVGQIILAKHAISAGLAGEYLAAARRAAHIPGPPVVIPAGPVDLSRLDTVLRITSVIQVKRSMIAGRPLPQAMRAAFVTSTGAATTLALEGGRETVQQSIQADPRVTKWRRIGSPNACKFCQMLISRNFVYKHETVDFAAHEHCACTAEPEFR